MHKTLIRLATRLENVTKLHCGNAAARRFLKRSGETGALPLN
jgi:hypothetical protein